MAARPIGFLIFNQASSCYDSHGLQEGAYEIPMPMTLILWPNGLDKCSMTNRMCPVYLYWTLLVLWSWRQGANRFQIIPTIHPPWTHNTRVSFKLSVEASSHRCPLATNRGRLLLWLVFQPNVQRTLAQEIAATAIAQEWAYVHCPSQIAEAFMCFRIVGVNTV